MRSQLRGLHTLSWGMLTFALLVVCTETAEAAKLTFRNEGSIPVVVQSTVIVRGQVQRGKPLLIQPGQTGNYDTHPAGNASITVYDATLPSRILFQGPQVVATEDINLSVRPDPTQPAKAKLEVVKPPPGPNPN